MKESPTPTPPAPGLYRHYKGGLYRVIGTARHSETDERLVLYRPLAGDQNEHAYWVRPMAMFGEVAVFNGQMQPRFAPLSPAEAQEAGY